MAYLIKVTLTWFVFLLLFELLFKNNAKFRANRIYLLTSIAIGLLIPLVTLPFGKSLNIESVQHFYTTAKDDQTVAGITTPQAVVAVVKPKAIAAPALDLMSIVVWLYVAGALFLFLKYLLELMRIVRLIRKNNVQICYGHKVITTGKMHSPYSFLNYTFLPNAAALSSQELEYIVKHEAAHHTRKHWLDLWLLQLVSIVFWFHPLVWRYRYLLQLQHEYEADAIAAGNDPYHYGRFLLQQTLLRGVPAITHSFHFSPIKNRIAMLTKINGTKFNNRKYTLLVPALLACTFLMAKTNTETENEIPGNKMSFNGNMLTWRQSDTVSYDRVKGQAEVVAANAKSKPKVIVGINDEPVYRNDYLQAQASYGKFSTDFADYVKDEFHKLRKNTADSLTYLIDLSLVVDKSGKIVYYNANFARDEAAARNNPIMNLYYQWQSQANALLEQIIAKSPMWKPAMNEGQPVNSYVTVRFPGC